MSHRSRQTIEHGRTTLDRFGLVGRPLRRTVRGARRSASPWVLARAERRVEPPAVALTFDDGPHPVHTNAVLEVLAAEQVPATFFLVGANARRHPEMVHRIVDEGHAVASHSMTHPDPRQVGLRTLWRDYRAGHLEVSDVVGRDVRLFRPPKGHLDRISALAVRRLGLRPYLWSLDAADWEPDLRPEDVVARLGHPTPGDVILLHDAISDPWAPRALDRSAMVEGLVRFLADCCEDGVRFVALR